MSDEAARLPQTRDAMHALCLADAVWAERYDGWHDLGRGGSATVVRTFSRDAGADIALKLFLGLSSEDRIRFQREVRNAQGLTSPFIVRTYSPFSRGNLAWIEMELVEGRDLRHELARRVRAGESFSIADVAAVASAVGQALATAHAAGVVHRDVKPANVLLPADTGRVAAKLGDFGIAHILGATRLTASGLIAATPEFAAPEVVAGGDAGPAADVYGLALCLYLMLSSNRAPFDLSHEAPPAQWLRAHAEATPTPIREHRRDTPEPLARLVDRALAKEPERRPGVTEILEGLGAPQPLAPLVRSTSPRRARPLVGLVGTGVAGAVLGGLAVGYIPTPMAGTGPTRQAASATTRAAESMTEATPRPGPSATLGPDSHAAASSPTPTTHVSPTDEKGRQPPPSALPSPASVSAPTTTPAAIALPPDAAVSLDAMIEGGLLTLTNTSSSGVTILRVVVTDDRRESHRMEVGERLRPNEDLLLALDGFVPAPEASAPPVGAEITVRDERGREGTIVLGPGRLGRPAS